jgi:hypothetical protein
VPVANGLGAKSSHVAGHFGFGAHARLRGASRDLDLQSARNQRNSPAIAFACWVASQPASA